MKGSGLRSSRWAAIRRRGLSTFLLALFVFGGIARCLGQEATLPEGESAAPRSIPITYTPPPTPPGKKKTAAVLGRLAVTGLGSLPFTLFYANFIFDTVRFVDNGFDSQYAPWPFKSQYSAEVTTSETFIRLGVALGLSAAIGLLDVIIPREQ